LLPISPLSPDGGGFRQGDAAGLFASGEKPSKNALYVYIVKTDIPAGIEPDLNEWSTEEHIPALASVSGCCRARRFLAVDGQLTYVAVYELENPEVIQSTAWAKARDDVVGRRALCRRL
jgi:hypothetical protein